MVEVFVPINELTMIDGELSFKQENIRHLFHGNMGGIYDSYWATDKHSDAHVRYWQWIVSKAYDTYEFTFPGVETTTPASDRMLVNVIVFADDGYMSNPFAAVEISEVDAVWARMLWPTLDKEKQ